MLHKYFILNDTYFYLSFIEEKCDFVFLELELELELYLIIKHILIEFNSIMMISIDW